MSAGTTIKLLREKAGMTQMQLSVIADVGQASISAYERGLYEPEMKTFEKIVNVLGYELVVRKKKTEVEE